MATLDDPDDVLFNLRALALFLRKGGRIVWEEPEPRGRKGGDRKPHRTVMLQISPPNAFDSVRWQMYRDDVGRQARAQPETDRP
ncbi:MAG: hypothetical protein AB7L91_15855 [Dehalococcoidia bacterium]